MKRAVHRSGMRSTAIRGTSRRRRGSLYLLVLMTSLIVSVIALSSLAVIRLDHRAADSAAVSAEAELLAYAAVERAISLLQDDSNWRGNYRHVHEVESARIPFGNGTISWMLVDEVDGILDNNPQDPVRLYGYGRIGDHVRAYRVLLIPGGGPLDVLRMSIHGDRDVFVGNATAPGTVKAINGPVSSNSTLMVHAENTLEGDADAANIENFGTITGSATDGAPMKTMPAESAFDIWAARATLIPWESIDGGGGKLEACILSPTSNPYGEANSEGIYRIAMPPKNHTLKIQDCRLQCTLIVSMEEGCTIDIKQSIWEPNAPNHPLLIAKAVSPIGTRVDINNTGSIDESSILVNLNPFGMPYNGLEDDDTSDIHPTMLKGLIHIIRPENDSGITRVLGSDRKDIRAIAEGIVEVLPGANVAGNAAVLNYPPEGYRSGSSSGSGADGGSPLVVPVQGTYEWVAVPTP